MVATSKVGYCIATAVLRPPDCCGHTAAREHALLWLARRDGAMSRKQGCFEPRCLLLMLPSLLLLPVRNPSAFHHARVPLDRRLRDSTAKPAPPPTWTPLARRIGPPLKESDRAQDVTGNNDKAVPGDDGGAGGEEIAPEAPSLAPLPLAAGAATAGTAAAILEGEAPDPVQGEQQEEGGEGKRECDMFGVYAIFKFSDKFQTEIIFFFTPPSGVCGILCNLHTVPPVTNRL